MARRRQGAGCSVFLLVLGIILLLVAGGAYMVFRGR